MPVHDHIYLSLPNAKPFPDLQLGSLARIIWTQIPYPENWSVILLEVKLGGYSISMYII